MRQCLGDGVEPLLAQVAVPGEFPPVEILRQARRVGEDLGEGDPPHFGRDAFAEPGKKGDNLVLPRNPPLGDIGAEDSGGHGLGIGAEVPEIVGGDGHFGPAFADADGGHLDHAIRGEDGACEGGDIVFVADGFQNGIERGNRTGEKRWRKRGGEKEPRLAEKRAEHGTD